MLFAPGTRVIIRDEEWMIKKCDTNSFGSNTLQYVGISPLVKDKPACFISDLERRIDVVDPAKTRLIIDDSPNCSKGRLCFESQWRQVIPTDMCRPERRGYLLSGKHINWMPGGCLNPHFPSAFSMGGASKNLEVLTDRSWYARKLEALMG